MDIVYLNNITKQYRVTYDRNNETLSMYRREAGLSNMEFQLHSSVLHMYHQNKHNESNKTFINTVLENMKEFKKR